jgi:MarR-like DNA-binding transcriptional regulator SgrR of sgrS sRNA
MRPIISRLIAAASVLLLLGSIQAARRPRYGGALRVETQAVIKSVDPAEPAESVIKEQITSQVFETWVRLDDKGEPRPLLALSWIHETARKRWVFAPRPNVVLHNGTRWEPGALTVADDQPIEQILRVLAMPRNAVVVRAADGSLVGTGPFRLSAFQPGKSISLGAHGEYWGGRPFLDAVEITLGRGQREQSLDFELGKADVVEAPVTEIRRLRQRGTNVAASPPTEVFTLAGGGEKLALAVDRAAIHAVLLQRQGEISGALLPQWLTGHAFLFPTVRDLAKARALPPAAQSMTFLYDRQDALMRSVAERVALNAAEAGVTLKPVASPPADVRLLRFTASSPDARSVLADMAAALRVAAPQANGFEGERQLLETAQLIPLFHLPAVYALGPKVRQWSAQRWRLDDVWLDERDKP